MVINEYQPSEEDLYQLREWIKKTPYIIQDYDNEFLEAIVRKCKGSLQRTKSLLENLNGLGFHYPEMFGHLDVSNDIIQEQLNAIQFFFLPKRAEDGSLVCVMSLNQEKIDPYKFHLFEGQRYMIMSFFVLVWEKIFESGKIILIFDWKNISPLHAREFSPVYLKKRAGIVGENYPLRIQAIHYINLPTILEWIVIALKSIMKKKIVDRFRIHNSVEALQKFVPARILPKDYGGDEESSAMLHSQWRKKIESYREKLIAENDKMRNLDSSRPKTNDGSDMVGSFRALKVD